ncbi:hypothetical protein RhiirA5_442380, partial [Rhizophagus irregularis]
MKEEKNKKCIRNEETKREQKMEKGQNEINRGPSNNQTHKIKEEIKLVGSGDY